jgi:hypothetical protein
MYDDSITVTGAAELLNARLAQAAASLRGTPVTTREDLLATVYSALNAVLSLGNNVTPLLPVAREGPAIAQRFRTLVRGGGLSRCGSATFA